MATQTEMSQTVAPMIEGDMESGGAVEIEQDIRIDEDAPPADFVPVEKEPVPVKKVEPKYPELAMRAGLEGKVWVKIWVDKEGTTEAGGDPEERRRDLQRTGRRSSKAVGVHSRVHEQRTGGSVGLYSVPVQAGRSQVTRHSGGRKANERAGGRNPRLSPLLLHRSDR